MPDLARLLRREGNLAASQRLFWHALAASDDKRGPEHPDSLSILSNLGAGMDTTESKQIYMQQLERHLRTVDFDHPDLFIVKFNLFQQVDENEQLRIANQRVYLRPVKPESRRKITEAD
jgi:hypothetical protein